MRYDETERMLTADITEAHIMEQTLAEDITKAQRTEQTPVPDKALRQEQWSRDRHPTALG